MNGGFSSTIICQNVSALSHDVALAANLLKLNIKYTRDGLYVSNVSLFSVL